MIESLKAVASVLIPVYLGVFIAATIICFAEANINEDGQTSMEAWHQFCGSYDKINYIFPAQILGCWLAEPIQGYKND